MSFTFSCRSSSLVWPFTVSSVAPSTFLPLPFVCLGKVTGIVTDLPIIGGITASGVFLLFISVVGLIGAIKHHQVMLFFYMVVLFLIFIIQFSCSCAALSVNTNDQKTIIKTVSKDLWKIDFDKKICRAGTRLRVTLRN